MYGKPVVFGPYMDNFQEISRLLKEHGGGFEVRDKNELEDRVKILLQDRDLRTISGEAAFRAVEENRGATRKTLELIETHLL
jgi:3-deoxy-D-manno-octulosonic-acid transferase